MEWFTDECGDQLDTLRLYNDPSFALNYDTTCGDYTCSCDDDRDCPVAISLWTATLVLLPSRSKKDPFTLIKSAVLPGEAPEKLVTHVAYSRARGPSYVDFGRGDHWIPPEKCVWIFTPFKDQKRKQYGEVSHHTEEGLADRRLSSVGPPCTAKSQSTCPAPLRKGP
jgi:hypothetical protein